MLNKPKIIELPEIVNTQLFSNEKEYEWTPDTVFSLKGIEFETLLKILKEEVYTTTGTSINNKVIAYNIVQNALIQAVENNLVKEK